MPEFNVHSQIGPAERDVDTRKTGTTCAFCGVAAESAGVAQIRVGRPESSLETYACLGKCADMFPCYVCGVTPGSRTDIPESGVFDPSLTPYERMLGVAKEVELDVSEVPTGDCGSEFAGFVGVAYSSDGGLRGMVGLADDLDDDLRTDVLAFGLATFASDVESIMATEVGGLGIGRKRLPEATRVGHLAWHMVRTVGRYSPSTTFDLVNLGVDHDSSELESPDVAA